MSEDESRLCDFCHEREAALFIEQVGGDDNRKIKVCMECAIERGFSPDPENIRESMATFIQNVEKEKRQAAEDKMTLCPSCGRSLADVKLLGRLGCPACYEAFRSYIASVMQKRGKKTLYTGSLPRSVGQFRSPVTDRLDLQNKEQEAVKNEDYEKAAFYRDCIKALH